MKESTVFEAHSSYVLGLLFTLDSATLVSAGMDNVVRLWSVPDWKLVGTFEGHANSVNSLALSPDERVLVTGSSDFTVKLWAFPDGQLLHTLQDRKKVVSAAGVSANGKWVGAGSYGGRAMVWTLEGDPVVGIKASQKNLSSVAFSRRDDTGNQRVGRRHLPMVDPLGGTNRDTVGPPSRRGIAGLHQQRAHPGLNGVRGDDQVLEHNRLAGGAERYTRSTWPAGPGLLTGREDYGHQYGEQSAAMVGGGLDFGGRTSHQHQSCERHGFLAGRALAGRRRGG